MPTKIKNCTTMSWYEAELTSLTDNETTIIKNAISGSTTYKYRHVIEILCNQAAFCVTIDSNDSTAISTIEALIAIIADNKYACNGTYIGTTSNPFFAYMLDATAASSTNYCFKCLSQAGKQAVVRFIELSQMTINDTVFAL